MKKILIPITAMALSIAGCATRGTDFNMSDVDSFKPGVTSLAEATEKLGKPRGTKYDENGRQLVTWLYATGLGAKGVRIVFDKNGTMERIAGKAE